MTQIYTDDRSGVSSSHAHHDAAENLTVKLEKFSPNGLEGTWKALEEKSNGSIFQSWAWVSLWLEKSSHPRFVLVVRSGDEPVGIGIFTHSRVNRPLGGQIPILSLHENANVEEDRVAIEYNGLLCKAGFEQHVHTAVINALLSARTELTDAPAWSEIRWPGCETELISAIQSTGNSYRLYRSQKAPYVDITCLGDDADAYMNSRSNNSRYQIRRAMRLLGEDGPLTIDRAETTDEALAAFKQMMRLHQLAWNLRGKDGAFSSEFFQDFHMSFLERNIDSGRADVLIIRSGRNKVGILYNLVYRQAVYAYQSGFELFQDNRIKPGLVSHALAIQYYKNQGVYRYLFLAGNDRYKRSLSTHSDTLYWAALQNPDFKMRLENVARAFKSRFEFDDND